MLSLACATPTAQSDAFLDDIEFVLYNLATTT
jgi:hypothetical protein